MPERRTRKRLRTLKGAKIAFGHGSTIDCVVRNFSGEGACLEVESPIGVPEKFILILDSVPEHHHCHVVWRTERRIGVLLTGARLQNAPNRK